MFSKMRLITESKEILDSGLNSAYILESKPQIPKTVYTNDVHVDLNSKTTDDKGCDAEKAEKVDKVSAFLFYLFIDINKFLVHAH